MTWTEYDTIMGRLEGKIETEKAYCANYLKNNPTDKQRKRDRDMIIEGIRRAMNAIDSAYRDKVINIQ